MIRKYIDFTDDAEEAFRIVRSCKLKSRGKGEYGFAEVRHMKDPPKTTHKFAVFQVIKKQLLDRFKIAPFNRIVVDVVMISATIFLRKDS